jgi:hypothetical protein
MLGNESLAAHQRRLLAALKGRASADERFGASLKLLRDTALWWRRYSIAQTCRFTAALLTAQGRFDAVVVDFVRATPGADDLSTQRDLFLARLQKDPDPLCAALAATEEALVARCGVHDRPPLHISWPQNPELVFAALLRGSKPPDGPAIPHTVTVGHTGGLAWRQDADYFHR